MKVLAYCRLKNEPEKWLPAVPVGLFTNHGYIKQSSPVFFDSIPDGWKSFPFRDPIDLLESYWIGIEHDGSPAIFPSSEEPKWRASRAVQAIEIISSNSRSTSEILNSVNLIQAAASLIGIQVPNLFVALSKARKSRDESLEETVHSLMEELSKSPLSQKQ